MSNTIYFIGAGFSKALGGPLQAEILPGILGLGESNVRPYGNADSFLRERDIVSDFIEKTFPNVHTQYRERIPLEDIFSILDRAILNKESFKGLPFKEMDNIRAALVHTIIYFFDIRLRNIEHGDVLRKFITEIFKNRNENSSISFITTNWDIILDNSIFYWIQDSSGSSHQLFFMDYGLDCYYLDNTPRTLGEHYANAKKNSIFKLHGSLNWLCCPNCNRMFHEIDKKIALREFINPQPCPFCRERNQNQQQGNVNHPFHLQSFIVMPTMLKE